ncbi:MAG: hypothetical protein RR548_04455 [Carnobacterium sp.]|uniref:hypothetical protein n=1 Tax=Carnobacterium sp. TaxID=48221 RepID=UPI002FCAFA2F
MKKSNGTFNEPQKTIRGEEVGELTENSQVKAVYQKPALVEIDEKGHYLETAAQAEAILNEAYRQSEEIYRDVQQQLMDLKNLIHENKCLLEQRQKQMTTQAHNEANEILTAAKQKADRLSKETAAKLNKERADYHAALAHDLERLTKEKEWFAFYQEQSKENLESKEKILFFNQQKIQDDYQLREQELQNQLMYYRELNSKIKIKSFKIGLTIFILTGISIVRLSFLQHPTFIVPILIACLAVYLVYINLTDGKTEKETKKTAFHNTVLIEQNNALKEEISGLEEDLKKLLKEKSDAEKADRTYTDRFQFLNIMQQDLKESEMNRKILESENAALRKYLISEDSTKTKPSE